jgi:hypothetical protein
MEASMHGTFEKSREVRDNNVRRSSGVGFLAVPVVIAVALVGLAITKPAVSTWIAEAAQAEFAGSVMMPEAAPTQLARPANEIRTIRAD